MVEHWDGTLSCSEFYGAASAFSEKWTKFNSSLPPWSWVPSPKRPWTSNDNRVNYSHPLLINCTLSASQFWFSSYFCEAGIFISGKCDSSQIIWGEFTFCRGIIFNLNKIFILFSEWCYVPLSFCCRKIITKEMRWRMNVKMKSMILL